MTIKPGVAKLFESEGSLKCIIRIFALAEVQAFIKIKI